MTARVRLLGGVGPWTLNLISRAKPNLPIGDAAERKRGPSPVGLSVSMDAQRGLRGGAAGPTSRRYRTAAGGPGVYIQGLIGDPTLEIGDPESDRQEGRPIFRLRITRYGQKSDFPTMSLDRTV